MAEWSKSTLARFRELGERLHAGAIEDVQCMGPQRHVALAHQDQTEFCVGWKHTLTHGQVREMTKKVLSLWAS
jgi:hypothetical protein